MITGQRAFEGNSQASLISAIMARTPAPASMLQPLAPPALDRVITKCLAKDPDARWQDAGDLADELKWIAEGSAATTNRPAAAVAVQTRSAGRLGWAAAAILATVLAGVLLVKFLWRPLTTANASATRFSISLPDRSGFMPQSTGASTAPIAVSPDGRRIAFVATGADKNSQIWLRPLDTLAAQPVAGTNGASSPFWSPDSRFLAFFADGNLKKIDLNGGPALTLCAAPENQGGSWSASGVIIFSASGGVLQKVPAAGGVPVEHRRPERSVLCRVARFDRQHSGTERGLIECDLFARTSALPHRTSAHGAALRCAEACRDWRTVSDRRSD
jgi:dipeptidyl aminopeptidase/acylaminoacyl peptidase